MPWLRWLVPLGTTHNVIRTLEIKLAGVRFAAHKYPGAEHGFNNDTTPRFNEAAAKLAWGRTLALFNRTLRG